jgi:ABC-2 type transport system ATP-binding protein
VVIIDQGRIVAAGTPQSLRESSAGNAAIRVILAGAPANGGAVLARVPGVIGVRPTGEAGGYSLECEKGADPRAEIFREVASQPGWALLEMARERASLEDIFVRLTTHDATHEAAREAPPPSPAVEENREVVS